MISLNIHCDLFRRLGLVKYISSTRQHFENELANKEKIKSRQEVINRFPPIYKNYKEGDVIDKSLMDLTYDKSVTRYPGGCLDWNLLFDIVRPRA